MSVEAAAIGLGGTITSSAINNIASYGMTKQARAENYYYGEKAAENADLRTRQLYNDLQSPKALLQQYQEAGLSPSLMFSGGGGQGAQPSAGAQGSGAAGISPQTYGVDLGQLAMQAAQIDLMKAQTKKTNAEAESEEERPEEIRANTAELMASAGLKNAQTRLTNLDAQLKEATMAESIDQMTSITSKMKLEVQKMVYETMSAQAQANVDLGTVGERIKAIELQNNAMQAKTKQLLAQTKLNQAQQELVQKQIWEIGENIAQKWYELSLEKARTETYEKFVNNLDEYQDEQIRLTEERLKHDIAIDWANFGLDVTELIKNVIEYNKSEMLNHLSELIK